jgi:hypothetical protein
MDKCVLCGRTRDGKPVINRGTLVCPCVHDDNYFMPHTNDNDAVAFRSDVWQIQKKYKELYDGFIRPAVKNNRARLSGAV